MNPQIRKLYKVAEKSKRRVIGLMSGTSLDGLDVALCEVTGYGLDCSVKLERFATFSYSENFKTEIRKIFAKQTIDFQQLCLLNPYVGTYHGQIVLDYLKEWGIDPSEIDLIASHGQTVYHAPVSQHGLLQYPNATLQIGDGDHLAYRTGITTVSDFRQKHVAAGGEGAPLAVYGDYLLFSSAKENRILLNMGGIANFTFLPATLDASAVFSTDTGPGNTLIDTFARKFFDKPYDEDGAIAAKGTVNIELLYNLKKHPFFDSDFPKTTGPEVFNLDYIRNAQQRSGTTSVSAEDLMATLTFFSADTIADAIKKVSNSGENYVIYVSGGGAHNPVLMQHIQSHLSGFPIRQTAEIGIPGDAKEAILFAVLANEAIAGEVVDFGGLSGVPNVFMGKISFPN